MLNDPENQTKGSINFMKRVLQISALIALAMLLPSSPAIAARVLVQEAKSAQSADNRAEALKKYLEAQNLEKAGNYSGAVQAYKAAIELDPSSAELRVSLGHLYLKGRNLIEAEKQALEAAKIAANDGGVRKLKAQVLIAQISGNSPSDREKMRAAIKELEEVTRATPAAKIEWGDDEIPALAIIGQLYWELEEQDKAIEAFKRASDTDSSADRIHYQLARLYYTKGKFRDALTVARKAYDANQKEPAYASILAKSLLRVGRSQEALTVYEKALGIKDAKPEKEEEENPLRNLAFLSPLMFDYAEALVETGRYEEAKKKLDPILKNAPKNSPYYLQAVDIYADAQRRAGKREDAVKTLEEALKGQDVSESLTVLYSLAETFEELQRFDKAIDTYEEALSNVVNPDGTVGEANDGKRNAGVILRRIALAYKMAGNREKTLATYDRMRKTLGEDSPLAEQLFIGELISEEKNQEAFDRATKAVTRFPDEQAFKLLRAQAAGKLGDMKTADSIMQGLLKNTKEDGDIYLFWSSVQTEANLLKEAEDNARKAISLDPDDISPLVTLSIIQNRQKKFKESEATLRKALEISPDEPTLLNNLGYFLADRGDRLPEAEALIRRAINIEPTNGSFMDSLGWVLFRQGKTEEAQKYLEQAAIYSPRSATIHDHLGDLYKKLGQNDKARAKWEEALKMATEPEEIKKIKEKLGKK